MKNSQFLMAVSLLSSNQMARWIFPERRQRVQTLTRFTSPSTMARTRWMFGYQRRFVFKWEWATFMPLIGPLLQISQTCAIYDTPPCTQMGFLSNNTDILS